MEFKVKWIGDESVKDFEEVLEGAFSSIASNINIIATKNSVLTVVCSIPTWMAGAFKCMVKEKECDLRKKGIISVKIGQELLEV